MNLIMGPFYELGAIDALYVFFTDVGKKGDDSDDTYLENNTFFTDLDAKKLRRRKLQN